MKRAAALFVGCLACGGSSEGSQVAYPAGPPVAVPAPPQLASLTIGLAEGSSICPASNPPAQLIVTGTMRDGRQLATATHYRGGMVWNEEHGLPHERFRITASAGAVTPIALYEAPTAAMALAETKTIDFRVDDLAQPGLFATVSVPVDFKCGASLALRGRNGGEGSNGSAGQTGEMGGSVEVAVAHLDSQAHGDLLLARVDGPTGRLYYLLQPGGAPLTIDVSGGDGGKGGEGLKAAVGYTSTNNYGDSSRDTLSYEGPPGPGGQGGEGGTATIFVDAGDRLLASAIRVINAGGRGGPAGENKRGNGDFARVTAQAGDGMSGRAGQQVRVVPADPSALFADELQQGFPIVAKVPATPVKARAKTAKR
ncbi:MAG TPA: hypothetical protein VL326_17015 [Kofleriaceae bacterium]|nr:hypothetical protein [Kofleriaceae bacterium]